MIRKINCIEAVLFDLILFKTTNGTCCHHYVDCDKTVELLVRLKNSKYFKGKRKFETFEDDYNDIEGAIKDYERAHGNV